MTTITELHAKIDLLEKENRELQRRLDHLRITETHEWTDAEWHPVRDILINMHDPALKAETARMARDDFNAVGVFEIRKQDRKTFLTRLQTLTGTA